MIYKGPLGDIRRNMNHSKNKEILNEQIRQINEDLEKELGTKITKKIWDLINILIIKVNQRYENEMDEIYEDTKDKLPGEN